MLRDECEPISRYDGKPLLRLFELYVLHVIGELHDFHRQGLEKMAPKLQKTFGGNGEWHEAIAAAGRMLPELPEVIRELWAKDLELFRRNRMELSPQRFAEIVVEEFPILNAGRTCKRRQISEGSSNSTAFP
jgi:hypothetical protein